MSYESVAEFLRNSGVDEKDIITFDTSSATVELAAEAIGCECEQIAKTVSVKLPDGYALIVCSGDMKLDNPKFKSFFSTKPSMIPRDEVLSATGHDVGGVCPFCVKPGVKVYLDVSLKRFDRIYTAAGSSNSVAGMSPQKLEEICGAEAWIDVCKCQSQSH